MEVGWANTDGADFTTRNQAYFFTTRLQGFLNKNDYCLYFELIKKIYIFFRVGGTSGKRCVDPTGKGFDMHNYLN